jgi:hypothetical protein
MVLVMMDDFYLKKEESGTAFFLAEILNRTAEPRFLKVLKDTGIF